MLDQPDFQAVRMARLTAADGLKADEIAAFRRKGAVLLRQKFPAEWLSLLRARIDADLLIPTNNFTRQTKDLDVATWFEDYWAWSEISQFGGTMDGLWLPLVPASTENGIALAARTGLSKADAPGLCAGALFPPEKCATFIISEHSTTRRNRTETQHELEPHSQPRMRRQRLRH